MKRQFEETTEDAADDDYMSDALLGIAQIVDPRPLTYSERRKKQLLEQQKKGTVKSRREQEKERREAGLTTQLPEDNKGFKLLAKMGYQKGMPIGPSAAEQALTEPIAVVVKNDRLGIGLGDDAPAKRLRTQAQQRQLDEEMEAAQGDYRTQMNRKYEERKILSDLRKARVACETLDLARGFPRQDFWLPETKIHEDDSSEEQRLVSEVSDGEESEKKLQSEFDVMEPNLQLAAVTLYLRAVHYYCIWCGLAYESTEDLSAKCPGETADAHD
ncbi:G patch domain-containing protein 11 [Gaertneriomyces sp. JEL0708]|nr:G patch domain-containing protein 11 [Gaertneriomyces sp. JEL0708]